MVGLILVEVIVILVEVSPFSLEVAPLADIRHPANLRAGSIDVFVGLPSGRSQE